MEACFGWVELVGLFYGLEGLVRVSPIFWICGGGLTIFMDGWIFWVSNGLVGVGGGIFWVVGGVV